MQQILAGLWSNGLDFSEIGVASMVLFAVIDIVGNIPLIIALREKTGEIYPMRTAGASLFILVFFLLEKPSLVLLVLELTNLRWLVRLCCSLWHLK